MAPQLPVLAACCRAFPVTMDSSPGAGSQSEPFFLEVALAVVTLAQQQKSNCYRSVELPDHHHR